MSASDMRALLVSIALLSGPALAETPLTAEAFEANVTGRTITYATGGSIFGIEEYLTGRRVRWSVSPDECQYGIWYQKGEAICFEYEANPLPHCWTFWLEGDVLIAQSQTEGSGLQLYESDRSDTPLPCPGPDVGV
jgi:hypothetical protein